MLNNRYIEIDSTYRNRIQDPEASYFTVDLAQSGTKTIANALDPISRAAPILAWNSSFTGLDSAGAPAPVAGSIEVLLADPPIILSNQNSLSSRETFLLKAQSAGPEHTFRTELNYYVGSVLTLTIGGVASVFRRIDKSEFFAVNVMIVTVESSILDNVVYDGGSIDNPTNATNTYTSPQVFLPSSLPIDNFYYGSYIQNIQSGETKTITYYDGTTHMATLDSNTSATWLSANTDFVIRKGLPANSGAVPIGDATNTLGGISQDLQVVQLASTASSSENAYDNSFLRLDHPVVASTVVVGATLPPYGEQIRITNYVTLDGTFIVTTSGTTSFSLSGGVATNDYYVGCMITNSTTNNSREIATYNGVTKTGTVTQAWVTCEIGNVFFIRSAFLLTPFTVIPEATGNGLSPASYSIEVVSRDNVVPLSYSGTTVSSQQEVCYEVELLNLILPNTTLASGNGGRVVFYPYVYVKFNTTTDSKSSNLIYSNNPNATKMLFRAVVDDTPQPTVSPFIKIDGDGMTQTVKFKPNDNFVFGVYLPNGDLFKTRLSETQSPDAPNPMIQISAVFSLRRI